MLIDANQTPSAPRVLALRYGFRVPEYVAGKSGKGRFFAGTKLQHRVVNDVIDEELFADMYQRDVNRLAEEFKARVAAGVANEFEVDAAELIFTGVQIAWHPEGERAALEQFV